MNFRSGYAPIALFLFSTIFAQPLLAGTCPKVVTAVRVDHAPKLDGRLDESEWQLAAPAIDFIQREPDDYKPETERTEVRLIYTASALFVGAWCFDTHPEQVVGYRMERDFDASAEDCFVISLDTYHDHRNCYYFGTNANGARYDAMASNDGNNFNPTWNGVWDVRSTKDAHGWYIEMEIPFSSLRFTDDSIQVWGVNFERDVQRRREFAFWAPIPRLTEATMVSKNGELRGLKNIHRGSNIEIKPFGVAGITRQYPIQNPYESFDGHNTTLTKTGFDLKAPLTSSLTLDLTVNPDYAQIEEDRTVINLTRYPIFNNERREFFLESAGTFSYLTPTTASMFYSRRIGIARGKTVPIIGGARVVGTVGSFDVGAFSMQTDKVDNIPTTNFSVLRLKRNIFGSSYFGMIATDKEQTNRASRTYGGDALFQFPNLIGRNMLMIGSSYTETTTPELPNRLNRSFYSFIAYPNPKLNARIGISKIERNFNPELGYVTRPGTFGAANLTYRFYPRSHGIDNITVVPMAMEYVTDIDNRLTSRKYSFSPVGITTTSGDYFGYTATSTFDRIDYDFPVASDVVIKQGDYNFTDHQIEIGTSHSRDYYGYARYSLSGYYTGQQREFYLHTAAQWNNHFIMATDIDRYDIRIGADRAIATSLGLDLNYSFTTLLQAAIYSQWNNQDNDLIVNYRLHWMPQLGSDIYLAYNHRRNTMERWANRDATVLLKVVYRIVV